MPEEIGGLRTDFLGLFRDKLGQPASHLNSQKGLEGLLPCRTVLGWFVPNGHLLFVDFVSSIYID
jgi:hypothetical protein